MIYCSLDIIMKSKILQEKTGANTVLDLSVSKAKTFADCKAKFRFQYIEKLPRKEWEHHIFGTFSHEVLENFHKMIIGGRDDEFHLIMKDAFKSAYENWKEKLSQQQLDEIKPIFKSYLQKIKKEKENNTLPKVTDVEKKFYINIDDKVLLTGFIDRVQIDPDGVVHVADYKTTKNKKYLKDYFQLLTYAFVLCLEDPTIKKVRASYILLRHDFDSIKKEFTRDEIFEIEEKYLKYADDICNEKIFIPKPTNLCKYCDFLDSCKEGKRFVQKISGSSSEFGQTDW